MKKRGCTGSQCDSQVVAVVLDIVSNSDGRYAEMAKSDREASKRLTELTREYNKVSYLKDATFQEYVSLQRKCEILEEKLDEWTAYIEKFTESLSQCETSEGRDAMRQAQMFVNTVTIKTVYDNTAFVIGLAAILSNSKEGEKFKALDELKAINPKLFRGDT